MLLARRFHSSSSFRFRYSSYSCLPYSFFSFFLFALLRQPSWPPLTPVAPALGAAYLYTAHIYFHADCIHLFGRRWRAGCSFPRFFVGGGSSSYHTSPFRLPSLSPAALPPPHPSNPYYNPRRLYTALTHPPAHRIHFFLCRSLVALVRRLRA